MESTMPKLHTDSITNREACIGIIGLGYVGLPLAVEFGKTYRTIGFDINLKRVEELIMRIDKTLEVSTEELGKAQKLSFTTSIDSLKECDVYIVTVPTPITTHKTPDLTALEEACASVGSVLRPGNVVIFESTVFPGCTEEVCVPILEKYSSLKFRHDFHCGYSPERINPGDKEHTLTNIVKVTSGSSSEAATYIDQLYSSIIVAGTHLAPSIKVAEAAKVIENSQRDINIAFTNELAKMFHLMGIDTSEVLTAASTKWNFLNFCPGLVGGHCIGVDPYYLTHKAQSLGYQPEVILAGRRLNDSMGEYVAHRVIQLMIRTGHPIKHSRVLILGITFKENCPDIRNSKVIDLISTMQRYGCETEIYDPWADPDEVLKTYHLHIHNSMEKIDKIKTTFQACILAVPHQAFEEFPLDHLHPLCVKFDIKAFFSKQNVTSRL